MYIVITPEDTDNPNSDKWIVRAKTPSEHCLVYKTKRGAQARAAAMRKEFPQHIYEIWEVSPLKEG